MCLWWFWVARSWICALPSFKLDVGEAVISHQHNTKNKNWQILHRRLFWFRKYFSSGWYQCTILGLPICILWWAWNQVWFGCGLCFGWVKCITTVFCFKSHACGGFEYLVCGSMQFQASNWVFSHQHNNENQSYQDYTECHFGLVKKTKYFCTG